MDTKNKLQYISADFVRMKHHFACLENLHKLKENIETWKIVLRIVSNSIITYTGHLSGHVAAFNARKGKSRVKIR